MTRTITKFNRTRGLWPEVDVYNDRGVRSYSLAIRKFTIVDFADYVNDVSIEEYQFEIKHILNLFTNKPYIWRIVNIDKDHYIRDEFHTTFESAKQEAMSQLC